MVTGVMATPCTALITTQFAVGDEAIVMPQFTVVVPAFVFVESLTWAVKVNGPAVVGVPEITPVAVSRTKPEGRLPEMIENEYGGTPPPATNCEEYGTPTIPVVLETHAKVIGGGGVMTIAQDWVAVPVAELPEESTTWDVNKKVPAWVGVPVIAPVEELRVRPLGSAPETIEKV